MLLMIDPCGSVGCLYGEEIDLAALGELHICRAGQVEPDAEGRWWANLRSVGGPVCGPFGRRSEALASERAWLESHWLTTHSSGGP